MSKFIRKYKRELELEKERIEGSSKSSKRNAQNHEISESSAYYTIYKILSSSSYTIGKVTYFLIIESC